MKKVERIPLNKDKIGNNIECGKNPPHPTKLKDKVWGEKNKEKQRPAISLISNLLFTVPQGLEYVEITFHLSMWHCISHVNIVIFYLFKK